jgi:hypothetical protein
MGDAVDLLRAVPIRAKEVTVIKVANCKRRWFIGFFKCIE